MPETPPTRAIAIIANKRKTMMFNGRLFILSPMWSRSIEQIVNGELLFVFGVSLGCGLWITSFRVFDLGNLLSLSGWRGGFDNRLRFRLCILHSLRASFR